jgi:RND family efflux transporter MFP subunit
MRITMEITKILRSSFVILLTLFFGTSILVMTPKPVNAQGKELSEQGKAADTNKDGVIQESEARGPLAANFDDMDCDKNGGLDGAEISGFFSGSGCPKEQPAAASTTTLAKSKFPPLSERSKASDTNKDGLIQKSEAQGPLEANFDDMDCDKNGGLDGAEIKGFFSGSGCPEKIIKDPGKLKTVKKITSLGKKSAPRGRPLQAVKLDDVVSKLSSETYQIVGRVVALQSGVLSARISGTINLVSVAVGERVKKGSVIATLATGRLITERKRAVALLDRQNAVLRVQKTSLKNAKREFSRMKSLLKSAAFSRARFEDLEGLVSEKSAQVLEKNAQVAEASASLERIDIDIRDATIRAPFEGVIIQKHVEVGTHVNTGAPVVTLINDRLLEIEIDVPSARINTLKTNTLASVILDDGNRLSAVVRAIIPREDLRTRTRPVRLRPEVKPTTKPLADNQAVLVELPLTSDRPVLTVSKDAVIRRANGNVVYVVNGTTASMRSVRVGRGIGDHFQILSGLKAGEKVVVRGNERLGGGGKVRVIR